MTDILERAAIDATDLHRSARLREIPGVVHGITKRVPGAGIADGNMGYSAPRDREDAWAMRTSWLAAAGLDSERIAAAHQVHGAEVAIVGVQDAGRGARPGSPVVGQADAIVTAERGVVAMTLHADCMPILLCDPIQNVVATVHAGWRGTVADIAGSTVRTMTERFGCDPVNLVAYLGPAIGECCYEVGDEVANAWDAAAPSSDGALVAWGRRWRFNLEAANRSLLVRAGVPPEMIDGSGICTKCTGETWFSHRGQGEHTGRYASFIALVALESAP